MKKILIYLYAFFIIYMPPFSDLFFNIPVQYVSLGLLLITIPLLFFFKYNVGIRVSKSIILLYLGIIISALYFAIRANVDNNDVRILQNLFILVQLTHIIIIIEFLKILKFNPERMLKLLLNLAAFQACIAILMIIFPEFKNLALQLYYLGREENVFISRMRIYGISGDYTFFTPIYHSILAILATMLAVFWNSKYIIYLPFIFIIIILNGRFGILIYLISIAILLTLILLKNKIPKKIFIIFSTLIVICSLAIIFLSVKMPHTYQWIVGGVNDTYILLSEGELQGNYKALAGSHIFIPNNLGLIFGEGHRVYSEEGISRGYNSSDIGYVNDLFMGGIIYIFILYGTILWYLLHGISKQSFLVKVLVLSFVVGLLVANYKGEVMRSGTILLGILYIKMVLVNEKSFFGDKTK